MTARTNCRAAQYSDQMHCATCGLVWDVNDPDPPACRPLHPAVASPEERRQAAHEQGIETLRRIVGTTDNK